MSIKKLKDEECFEDAREHENGSVKVKDLYASEMKSDNFVKWMRKFTSHPRAIN